MHRTCAAPICFFTRIFFFHQNMSLYTWNLGTGAWPVTFTTNNGDANSHQKIGLYNTVNTQNWYTVNQWPMTNREIHELSQWNSYPRTIKDFRRGNMCDGPWNCNKYEAMSSHSVGAGKLGLEMGACPSFSTARFDHFSLAWCISMYTFFQISLSW
jgi:hypothetical protein